MPFSRSAAAMTTPCRVRRLLRLVGRPSAAYCYSSSSPSLSSLSSSPRLLFRHYYLRYRGGVAAGLAKASTADYSASSTCGRDTLTASLSPSTDAFVATTRGITTTATTNDAAAASSCCFAVAGNRRWYGTTPPRLQLAGGDDDGDDDYPPHTLFPMPALSPTMESGSIAGWSVSEGQAFVAGDVLCQIETDKATLDFEAQDDGILAKILVQGQGAAEASSEIAVGTPICVVVEEDEHVSAFSNYSTTTAAAEQEEEPTAAAAAVAGSSPSSASFLMPSARHLSQSRGLDATVLDGSGKGGRVTKGDVLAAIRAGTLPPLTTTTTTTAAGTSSPPPVAPPAEAPAASATTMPLPTEVAVAAAAVADLPIPAVSTGTATFEDSTNNKMRKIIAQRLTESKATVPHFYTSIEVCLDEVLALRKRYQKDMDVKVSVNDFIIKACAMALRDVPEVNGTYDDENASGGDALRYRDSIDVSVAVATPTGLITPIVFDTDKLGLAELSAAIRDLATRARDGKLAPEEYQGGTFSVSNLGMFGITEFSAVINPPQAAILAVGGGSRRVVPGTTRSSTSASSSSIDETTSSKGGKTPPRIETIMTARLSADRRVVDEALVSLFLANFARYMSKPELLLL